MKLYYKIRYGYENEREISIEDTELEKAIGVFLTDGKALFKSGAIKGSYIQAITPDFHRIMDWNQGYELNEHDRAELTKSGVDRKARDFQSLVEQRVKYLISTNQQILIGKNEEVKKS